MDSQFVGKRVPWSQLEEYLGVQKTIDAYLTLLDSKAMDKAAIETNLPKSFWMINEVV